MVFRQRNSQRFSMDMSAAEVKRAASAQPPSPASDPNGSEILVRSLQAEGVKFVWGYPGGAVLYIYDALYKQDSIEHVLVRHEQAAIHAADGFARATGEVGVALVTSGPGVTNAITGIATAYMDSIPMVIITGQVPTHAIGQDAFQECDAVGITRPIVKHNFLVKDVRDLALTIKKAFHIARTGRPGPVVVDIPKDVSLKTMSYTGYPEQLTMRSYNPVRKGHGGQIRKAAQLLLSAKRPYIYTGGGVVQGTKSFQPAGDLHVELGFHVVCVGDGPDQQVATAYVSAQQDKYALKKSSTAASLGVSAIGSISVPLSSTDDSLVKVASETITAHTFYDRFFVLMQRMLRDTNSSAATAASGPEN